MAQSKVAGPKTDDVKPLDLPANTTNLTPKRLSVIEDTNKPLTSVKTEDVTGKVKAKESQSLTFNVGLSDTAVVQNQRFFFGDFSPIPSSDSPKF